MLGKLKPRAASNDRGAEDPPSERRDGAMSGRETKEHEEKKDGAMELARRGTAAQEPGKIRLSAQPHHPRIAQT